MVAQLVLVLSTTVVVPPPVEDDLPAFEQWVQTTPVGDFEKHLAAEGLNGVVPTRQLVRTASDWRKCGGPSGRIHIDTGGYRTWGATHRRESAYCPPIDP